MLFQKPTARIWRIKDSNLQGNITTVFRLVGVIFANHHGWEMLSGSFFLIAGGLLNIILPCFFPFSSQASDLNDSVLFCFVFPFFFFFSSEITKNKLFMMEVIVLKKLIVTRC